MKKIYLSHQFLRVLLSFLFLFLFRSYTIGQTTIVCPDTLHFCAYGKTQFNINLPDDTYVLTLLSEGSSSGNANHTGQCLNGIFTFDFNLNPAFPILKYQIKKNNTVICEGNYQYRSCIDEMNFDYNFKCRVDNDDCFGPVGWTYSFKSKFCQWDTTLVYIEPNMQSTEFDLTLNQPLNINRFGITKGDIVAIRDNQIDILWTETGDDCVSLTTTTKFGDTFVTKVPVHIAPGNKIEVYHANNPVDSLLTICEGSAIELDVVSETSENIKWIVSDGRVFNGFKNKIKFDTYGEYNVTVGNDGDECRCIKSKRFKIIVLQGTSPKITCNRTVCQGETATYYSDKECSQYLWLVPENGKIVDGGKTNDFFITVLWEKAGAHHIELSTPDCDNTMCSNSTKEEINVIAPSVIINGVQIVCDGETVSYEIPDFKGTKINWNVPPSGTIIQGQGTGAIIVKWNSDNKYKNETLSVSFENCQIGCNGTGQIPITIKPKLKIDYKTKFFCLNIPIQFTNNFNTNSLWQVYDNNNNLIYFDSKAVLEYEFNSSGRYYIKIINNDIKYCNQTDSVLIDIVPPINKPKSISGPDIICIGENHTYVMPGLKADEIAFWTVYDGDSLKVSHQVENHYLTYIWKSGGPYKIKVKIVNTYTNCESEEVAFYPTNINHISGNEQACLGQEYLYSTTKFSGTNVTWSISPIEGGSIISTTENSCNIKWIKTGVFYLKSSQCGSETLLIVNVNNTPSINFTYDELYCFSTNSKIEAVIDSGSRINIYSLDFNDYVTSENPAYLIHGNYKVEIIDKNNCKNEEDINIKELPLMEVEIYTFSASSFCDFNSPITLFSKTKNEIIDFQWYRNGLLLPSNGPNIEVNDFGQYHLIVKDINGCSAYSNYIILTQCCENSTIDVPNVPNSNILNISCTEKLFEILPPYTSTNFRWSFDEPYSNQNFAEGFINAHEFEKAGIYKIKAVGNADCFSNIDTICGQLIQSEICESVTWYVEIPISADFHAENTCAKQNVKFKELCTYLPSKVINKYEWDFGDPASGLLNYSFHPHPSHVYNSAGSYFVTLIIFETSGCSDTIIKQIRINSLPTGNIASEAFACNTKPIQFDIENYDPGNIYKWNFDDKASGSNNKSNIKSPIHLFSNTGIYNIILSSRSTTGCTNTDSFLIEINSNTLNGQILSDKPMPKCFSDEVELTFSRSSLAYLWNTGETTQSIKVKDQGNYQVTVTDHFGCEFVSKPFAVVNNYVSDAKIFSRDGIPGGSLWDYVDHFDSLVVCKGSSFAIQCTYFPKANFKWSNGLTGTNYMSTYDQLKNLEVGSYTFYVDISFTNSTCSATAGPFVIKVTDAPYAPNVMSLTGPLCENKTNTLAIKNHEPNIKYVWSTGQEGTQININTAGEYTVNANNVNGCKSAFASLKIENEPSVNAWMTGCIDACFPKDLCVSLQSDNKYQLIFNGLVSNNITENSTIVTLQKPGDYQLLATDKKGCSKISDILSVSAIPQEHALKGSIFIDKDSNSLFQSLIDSVLADIPIFIKVGNTIIDSTMSDSLGLFLFDSIYNKPIKVLADISGLNLQPNHQNDTLIIFDNCISNKIHDIPLYTSCNPYESKINKQICAGDSVLIKGRFYKTNQLDTIQIQSDNNCDSIIYIEVKGIQFPSLEFELSPSCIDGKNGTLNILNTTILDSFKIYVDDDEINTLIKDKLESGNHTLRIESEQHCSIFEDFYISNIDKPSIEIEVINTCFNSNNGLIICKDSFDLSYKLFSHSDYTSLSTFENLEAGKYYLFYRDNYLCEYIDSVTINTHEKPIYSITTNPSCELTASGEIQIESHVDNILFSLNNGAFSEQTTFANLHIGQYVLYVKDQNECLDSLEIEILNSPIPEFIFDVIPSCIGSDNGSITIINSGMDHFEYKLNDSEYSKDSSFNKLESGMYDLIIKDSAGCEYDYPLEVENYPVQNYNFVTSLSCEGINNGSIKISPSQNPELFSLNDTLHWSDNLEYESLAPGDYTLFVKHFYQCLDSFHLKIGINNKPTLFLETIPICEDLNEGRISFTTPDSLLYSIDGSAFEKSETFLTSDSVITLYYKDISGCIYDTMLKIEYHERPTIDIISNGSCDKTANGSIQLLSSNENVLFSIDKVHFALNSLFDSLPSGQKNLYYKIHNDCIYSAKVDIPLLPFPEQSIVVSNTCPNYANGSINIYTGQSNTVSINNSDYIYDHTFENLDKGYYLLNTKNEYGCIISDSVLIEIKEKLEIEFPDIVLDCSSEFVTIHPKVISSSGNLIYIWNDNINEKSLNVSKSGKYNVLISDECDSISHSWELEFFEQDINEKVAIPNIFYPNSVANNCFKPTINVDQILNYRLSIYDRWGNLAFRSTDNERCWDGYINGQPAVDGVYVYTLELVFSICNKIENEFLLGDVTIIH